MDYSGHVEFAHRVKVLPRGSWAVRLRGWARARVEWLLVPVVLALTVAAWDALVRVANYPAFLLPRPALVWERFTRALIDGTLWHHAQITLLEVVLGLALGLTVAVVLGYFLASFPLFERLATPYIVASQSVPIIAIAPLLVIWFGFGITPKVLVCALIVFFPSLINTIVGLRSVQPELRDLLRTLEASRWQTFTLLEVPAALPVLLGGLKISTTLSVVGAVVGEFVGANRGLGFLLNYARGIYDTPLLFVALFTLIAIAITFYAGVSLLESWLLRWHRTENSTQ